ncbi:uncharacterized protein K444DRAFT_714367, partial [Hyaloscypha bicolor E]
PQIKSTRACNRACNSPLRNKSWGRYSQISQAGHASLATICVRMGVPRTRCDDPDRAGGSNEWADESSTKGPACSADEGTIGRGRGSATPDSRHPPLLPSSRHLGSGLSCTQDRLPRAALFPVGMLSRPRSQPRSQACAQRSAVVRRRGQVTPVLPGRERGRERGGIVGRDSF